MVEVEVPTDNGIGVRMETLKEVTDRTLSSRGVEVVYYCFGRLVARLRGEATLESESDSEKTIRL